MECLKKSPSLSKNKIQAPHISKKAYKLEHSKVWERKDKEADKFFVYIPKGNNAKYYVGQTRDLRARLSEHRDGKTRSTAGSNIQLQYFEEFKTRKEAELREVALKKLVQNDERQIRKMIINFQDRIKEVRF